MPTDPPTTTTAASGALGADAEIVDVSAAQGPLPEGAVSTVTLLDLPDAPVITKLGQDLKARAVAHAKARIAQIGQLTEQVAVYDRAAALNEQATRDYNAIKDSGDDAAVRDAIVKVNGYRTILIQTTQAINSLQDGIAAAEVAAKRADPKVNLEKPE